MNRNAPYRLIEIGADAAPELLELSPVLVEAVAQGVGTGDAPPTVVVRRQRPYALLGPQDARLPRLEAGLAVLRDAGLPVYERIAGGAAVILDEGCVSFAVVKPCRDLTTIQRNFREMAAGVVEAVAELGAAARFGEAPGSFCPGPFDLVVDGRKIAGVAQALRRGFALVSGMLLVRQDPVPVTELLNAFYRASGGAADLTPDHVIHLSRLLGRDVPLSEVEHALKIGFDRVHGLTPGGPTPQELERARQLSSRRRLA